MSKQLRRMSKQLKKLKKKKTHSGGSAGKIRKRSQPNHPPTLKKKNKIRPRKGVTQIYQRTSIMGALKYDHARSPQDSVFQILAECLTKGAAASVTGDVVVQFFTDAKVASDKFCDACLTDWHFHPEVVEYILALLKLAGYEGHIDDLWLSVYGILKPSPKPKAFGGREVRPNEIFPNRPWWVTHSKTVHTGQTRKPGSHGSK